MTPQLKAALRRELVMEITAFRAAANNAYTHFHGQEEGEDQAMDKYWRQEKEAEEALYAKIERLVVEAEKRARLSKEET